MIEYWIRGAKLISAAVMIVCFLVSFIVINMQEAGRGRNVAALGVALLAGSMVAGSVNESVASVYGTATVTYAVGWVVVGGFAAAGLVLLALALAWVRKKRMARGDH